MKNFCFCMLMAATFSFIGCAEEVEPVQPSPSLTSYCGFTETVIDTQLQKEGRIYELFEGTWVIDINIDGQTIRCAPCNFPDELKVENKSIVLDAHFYKIPPNVRVYAHPIKISRLY